MKPYFRNLDIECWRHSGRVGKLELCLFQEDGAACAPLLLALDELEAAGPPARRTLTLKPCQRRRSCSSVRLILSLASDDLRQMHISSADSVATIEVTPAGLQRLRSAVMAWRDGAEDFVVSPTWERNKKRELGSRDLASGELWFWGPFYSGP